MTHSTSLLDSLKTPPRKEEQRLRVSSSIIGETKPYCPFDLVMIPSHYEVTRSELFDKLAKQELLSVWRKI